MTRDLLIVGAGGHGRSVLETLRLEGRGRVVGFLDDGVAEGTLVMEIPVIGPASALPNLRHFAHGVVIAIGVNAVRERLVEVARTAGFALPSVVHPSAIVSPSAVVEEACAIMAGAIVGTEAHLCQGAIVNCGAVVDHHARVGAYGHLGVRAGMAGASSIGRRAWMQAGSAIGYGVHLPDEAVLTPCQGVGR